MRPKIFLDIPSNMRVSAKAKCDCIGHCKLSAAESRYASNQKIFHVLSIFSLFAYEELLPQLNNMANCHIFQLYQACIGHLMHTPSVG